MLLVRHRKRQSYACTHTHTHTKSPFSHKCGHNGDCACVFVREGDRERSAGLTSPLAVLKVNVRLTAATVSNLQMVSTSYVQSRFILVAAVH